MIRFDQAQALLAGAVTPLAVEEVPLMEAAGRVLAAPVLARYGAPRRAVATMDGYAVVDAATRPGEPLQVIGESRAGAGFAGPVAAGQAVRIFTGAPMPAGADRCVVQEAATRDGDRVWFAEGYGPEWHVRPAGADFRQGTVLVAAGARLTPQALVAAAAGDVARVEAAAPPRVAIVATGDELALPGASAAGDRIPDSITPGVAALALQAGATTAATRLGRDDLPALERLAGEVLELADVVVVTGGASVGERDFAKPMFAPHGLEMLFSKVAMKPGRPVWLGVAKGRWVLGLPGNPTSAVVTARLFLVPLLAALQGRPPGDALRWRTLGLAAPLGETGSRETFARARWGPAGLEPIGNQDSGAQHALGSADWLIRCPPGQPQQHVGAAVTCLAMQD